MVRRLGALVFTAAMVIVSTTHAQEQAARGIAPGSATNPPAALSKSSLKWLAGGVALYPDPVLEKVLEAAQTPGAVHQAAASLASPGRKAETDRLPESVAYLARTYPDTLRTLDAKPGLIGRLGREFHEHPDQVWSAIDEFRSEVSTRKNSGPNGTPAASDEEASQAASQALAGQETQAQLRADEAAATPTYQSVVPAGPSTTVVPTGGTAVIGTPTYPATYGYSAGYYPSGVGGYVRRGWYGHGAFKGVGGTGWSRSSSWSHHGGYYDHADAGRVNAANRSLARNWSGLHHGNHEGHHDAEHHHSSEHHGEHHSAEHHGEHHSAEHHGGAHHGGHKGGGHHGGGHHGGKK